MVWADNCTFTDLSSEYEGTYPCNAAPLYLNNSFETNMLKFVDSFTNVTLSGYVTSGNIYEAEVCLSECQLQYVYAVSSIT